MNSLGQIYKCKFFFSIYTICIFYIYLHKTIFVISKIENTYWFSLYSIIFNKFTFNKTFWFVLFFTEKQRLSLCVGCGGQIHDQYILRVAPDLEWHAACLKCQECRQFLDESCTCFVRDGKTYCKRDYVRWVLQQIYIHIIL